MSDRRVVGSSDSDQYTALWLHAKGVKPLRVTEFRSKRQRRRVACQLRHNAMQAVLDVVEFPERLEAE